MSDERTRIGMTALLHELAGWLPNVAQMLDEMKTERKNGRGLPWTEWNQQQQDEIPRFIDGVKAAQVTRKIMRDIEP